MKCPKCQAGTMELVDQYIHMQTFRCTICGHTNSSEMCPPMTDVGRDFKARVIWTQSEPSAMDAMAVRDLDPTAANISITALLTELRAKRTWELGRKPEYLVGELKKRARGLGLEIELVEVPE